MAMGHGGGGPSKSVSNHPALASASASPPFPRKGAVGSVCISNSYNPAITVSNSCLVIEV